MITTIDRYIIKKFLGSFFFILIIFLTVTIVIDISEKVEDFIERKPPLDLLIFSYYKNFIIFYGNLLSPICIFLAVIFFTSVMTGRTEVVAILSSGVSFNRFLRPYIITGLFLAGVSFYLNAYMVPVANQERIDFEYQYLKVHIPMMDRNIHKKVAQDSLSETYIELETYNQIENVGSRFKMEQFRNGERYFILSSPRINWVDSTSSWHLIRPRIRIIDGMNETIYMRPEFDTTFSLTPDDIYIKEMKAESLPLDELGAYYQKEKLRGSDILKELEMEQQERFAYPFAAIVLTLIGVSLSTKKRRGGTPLQIGIGLVLSFIYVTLIVIGMALVEGDVPVTLAVWYPHVLFLALGIFLLRIAPK